MGREYSHIWAFSKDRIEEYFLSAGARISPCSEVYTLEKSCIIIRSCPSRSLGGMEFPQTEVTIQGDDSDEILDAFKLNFLSGGA